MFNIKSATAQFKNRCWRYNMVATTLQEAIDKHNQL